MAHITPEIHSIGLTHDGRDRHYLVHVPTGVPAKPQAVVMFLHGAGATDRWSLAETRLADAADRHGFVAVLPEALPLDPTAPSKFLRNPPVWTASHGAKLGTGRGHDDVGFLAAVLDDLPRHVALDPRRVYFTGFSNGAAMIFRAAAELADRIAAIAPVAGYCLIPDPRPARPVPTLYMIGDADPLVPLAGGEVRSPWTGQMERRPSVRETLDRWSRAIGCATEPAAVRDTGAARVEEYPAAPGGAEMVAMVVAGLGHHWPGGRGQLKRRIAGDPVDAVNANDVIWEFFQSRRLAA